MRILGDLYREMLLLVKNIITKIPRRYIITAIVLSIAMVPIFYQFFLPKISDTPPPAIIPKSAVRVHPPPDEDPIRGSATARIWTTEVFLIPDTSTEETVSFYRKRFFRCEPADVGAYSNMLSDTRWKCVRGRAAQHFVVWIDDSGRHGTVIQVEVSIYPIF